MRTKKPNIRLTPESEINIRGTKEVIKVVDLLSELQKKFPDGFYSRDATEYLKELYGDDLRVQDLGANWVIYKALAKEGFLKIVGVKKSTPAEPHKLTGQHHIYKVNQDNERVLKLDVPYNLSIPPELNKLLTGYVTLMAVNDRDEAMTGALEKMVLGNENYLRIMETIKRESPKVYASMGGPYLDRLLERELK